MVDGVGSVDVAYVMLDSEPEGGGEIPDPQPPSGRAAPVASAATGLVRRGAGAIGKITSRGKSIVMRPARGALDLVTTPGQAREALHSARALVEVIIRDEIISAPKTSLNLPIGGKRRLGVVTISLDEIKQLKSTLGGTVNDVVLALTAGAMRRLLLSRAEEPPAAGLRAMVPVNVRTSGDRLALGNKVSSLFVRLPVAEEDPLDRYRAQIREAESLKSGDEARGTATMIGVSSLAPPILHSTLARSMYATRLFNLTITNVPGPPQAAVRAGVADARRLADRAAGRRARDRPRGAELRRQSLLHLQRRPRCRHRSRRGPRRPRGVADGAAGAGRPRRQSSAVDQSRRLRDTGTVKAAPGAIERHRISVDGIVQGVGFRPFVHGLACSRGLGGFVLNAGGGVVVEVEGDPDSLRSFARALSSEAPALAEVGVVHSAAVAPRGERRFRIEASSEGPAGAQIPADAATCDECLRELWDPANRRHRHPFINCTQCGPRLTIVRRPPYDRANTTMTGFEMCSACRAEYEDPADRRFHAEPIACPDCGPRLAFGAAGGEQALALAVDLLRGGSIVAVKGLGGYHLACDAADEEAVARLRERKRREQKPFALMTTEPELLATIDEEERMALRSPQRPIVLLRRRPDSGVARSVAPGSPWLGVMLPYTGLHHLLCAEVGGPLVMTSGNRCDEPIATGDAEARERLDGIADGFLAHDRPIHRRCEDSVVRSGFPVRRSRGFAPGPLPLGRPDSPPIVAVGAELKSTFCVARGAEAFLSPHLGDLDSPLAYEAFRSDLGLYLEMLGVRPELIAHDLHPDYLSTRWALSQDAETMPVQHHHAHAAACLAENGEGAPALALVFDGTGYGPDGTLWGGELLRCSLERFERLAHLDPVPLPGGEAAIREPWRMAAAYLEAAGRPVPFERWPKVRQSLTINAPRSSGMGRLFDAAAALLGAGEAVSYEGQAAIELEQLAGEVEAEPYGCRLEAGRIHGADLIAAVHDDLDAGRPREQIAAAFHEGVAAAAAAACAEVDEPPATVALSGGSFQNLRLLRGIRGRLASLGFGVLTHRRLPPNDGGISFGQAVVAARRTGSCA